MTTTPGAVRHLNDTIRFLNERARFRYALELAWSFMEVSSLDQEAMIDYLNQGKMEEFHRYLKRVEGELK